MIVVAQIPLEPQPWWAELLTMLLIMSVFVFPGLVWYLVWYLPSRGCKSLVEGLFVRSCGWQWRKESDDYFYSRTTEYAEGSCGRKGFRFDLRWRMVKTTYSTTYMSRKTMYRVLYCPSCWQVHRPRLEAEERARVREEKQQENEWLSSLCSQYQEPDSSIRSAVEAAISDLHSVSRSREARSTLSSILHHYGLFLPNDLLERIGRLGDQSLYEEVATGYVDDDWDHPGHTKYVQTGYKKQGLGLHELVGEADRMLRYRKDLLHFKIARLQKKT